MCRVRELAGSPRLEEMTVLIENVPDVARVGGEREAEDGLHKKSAGGGAEVELVGRRPTLVVGDGGVRG